MPAPSHRWFRFSLKRLLIVVTVLSLMAAFAFVAWPKIWKRIDAAAGAIHQRSVTRSIAAWEREYSQISSDADAEQAEKVLDYIRHYYVPGEGYRSDPETEKRLEDQRRHTLDAISNALEAYREESASGKSLSP